MRCQLQWVDVGPIAGFSITEVVAVPVSPMPASDKVNVNLVVAGRFDALGVNTRLSNALVTSFT